MKRQRPVLLLPSVPPHGTPLAPDSKMAIRLVTWANGAITRQRGDGLRTATVDHLWRPVVQQDTIHKVFEVVCLMQHEDGPLRGNGGSSNIRTIPGRRALRRIHDVLDGRVVILCGRMVEHVFFGADQAPYGAVRMVNLNNDLLSQPRCLLDGERRAQLLPVLCTTVIAPNPAPANQPKIVFAAQQATRLEFGRVYRDALKLKHQPPRILGP